MDHYELRVSAYRPERAFPTSTTFSSKDEIWQKWVGDDAKDRAYGYEDVVYEGLKGVEGLAEATAREYESEGYKRVLIERREVGPWEEVQRDK